MTRFDFDVSVNQLMPLNHPLCIKDLLGSSVFLGVFTIWELIHRKEMDVILETFEMKTFKLILVIRPRAVPVIRCVFGTTHHNERHIFKGVGFYLFLRT